MKVRARVYICLEARGDAPVRVFSPGEVVEVEDVTALASPWAFEPIEPVGAGSKPAPKEVKA